MVVHKALGVALNALTVARKALRIARRGLGVPRRTLGIARTALGVVRRLLGVVRRLLGAARKTFGVVRKTFGVVRRLPLHSEPGLRLNARPNLELVAVEAAKVIPFTFLLERNPPFLHYRDEGLKKAIQ
jgi:hypothetical protein